MLRPRILASSLSRLSRTPVICIPCLQTRQLCQSTPVRAQAPDHRKLGRQEQLFLQSDYSPGSPIFLPHGTRIFNRLVDFLRKQYVRYGFQEVITPSIYKKELWAKSGHLENYADDMYSVTGGTPSNNCCGSHNDQNHIEQGDEDGEFGLKPMNCPGHCLIFASQLRSYRDLPIRYADFSPLHRNEISGALTGLTRVRRFHQDDGHIFCRPIQVEEEIKTTLEFVKDVYEVLRLGSYRLALSTRPKDHFIGDPEEWDRAETALRRALDSSGMEWSLNEGDGAFYGPKIDIILKDSYDKEHQTATVQLDFQLPKRFGLEYQAPAVEYETRGETTTDPKLLEEYGPVRPVMIHRAVLGSVERLMALLIEKHDRKWPFWLNPKQVMVLPVNNSESVLEWAKEVQDILLGLSDGQKTVLSRPMSRVQPSGLTVDIDDSAKSVGARVGKAKAAGYGQVLVIGDKEAESQTVKWEEELISAVSLRNILTNKVSLYEQ